MCGVTLMKSRRCCDCRRLQLSFLIWPKPKVVAMNAQRPSPNSNFNYDYDFDGPARWLAKCGLSSVLRQSRRPNPTWPHGNMGNCIQIEFELKIKTKTRTNIQLHIHIGVVRVQWLFKMYGQLQLISAPKCIMGRHQVGLITLVCVMQSRH